ncbi:MAG: hypothetical protein IPN69_07965 [Acidobacteria bacterium]|nr:hypothetical protein [Acidobacteriota bacterium]
MQTAFVFRNLDRKIDVAFAQASPNIRRRSNDGLRNHLNDWLRNHFSDRRSAGIEILDIERLSRFKSRGLEDRRGRLEFNVGCRRNAFKLILADGGRRKLGGLGFGFKLEVGTIRTPQTRTSAA